MDEDRLREGRGMKQNKDEDTGVVAGQGGGRRW